MLTREEVKQKFLDEVKNIVETRGRGTIACRIAGKRPDNGESHYTNGEYYDVLTGKISEGHVYDSVNQLIDEYCNYLLKEEENQNT